MNIIIVESCLNDKRDQGFKGIPRIIPCIMKIPSGSSQVGQDICKATVLTLLLQDAVESGSVKHFDNRGQNMRLPCVYETLALMTEQSKEETLPVPVAMVSIAVIGYV